MHEHSFIKILVDGLEWSANQIALSPDVIVKGSSTKPQYDNNTATLTFSGTKVVGENGVVYRDDSEVVNETLVRFMETTYFKVLSERIPFSYSLEEKEKKGKKSEGKTSYIISKVIRLNY